MSVSATTPEAQVRAVDLGLVNPILDGLDAEQRAAATLPDGPAQIIAPAGSGKTTTMVARLAVLLGRGVPPERICVLTFNRDAAADLGARVARQLGPSVPAATTIEIRTLHAIARKVLLDAGDHSELVADRLPMLRAARRAARAQDPETEPPDASALDAALSAHRIEGRAIPPEAQPALVAYAASMRARGAIDFDDLVVRAGDLLDGDTAHRQRWQGRFLHVCVDEFQDVDAAQLRLVRLLAGPEDNLFVVGDDDQTIYAWRLADVRRILRFTDDYPTARRVMLATNYRCPRIAVQRSAALVAVNVERFAKPIRAPTDLDLDPGAMIAWSIAGEGWARRLATVAAAEDTAGRTCCFLTRTRAELMPVVLALVRLGVRHTGAAEPITDAEPVREVVERLRGDAGTEPAVTVVRRLRAAAGWSRSQPSGDLLSDDDHAALDALTGWALTFQTGGEFLAAFDRASSRIRALRDPEATVELATVHGSKGREWETVVIVGFEADRMPNRRSLLDAADPRRAMEEERRLAYVALTRATRRLVLAFDPERPSPFLAEMGLAASASR